MDENLKKDLYNYSETPPDRVWGNIDAHFKAKGKNRAVLFFFLAVLFISGGLYTYMNIENDKELISEIPTLSNGSRVNSNAEIAKTATKLPESTPSNSENATVETIETKDINKISSTPQVSNSLKTTKEKTQQNQSVNGSKAATAQNFREILDEISIAQTPVMLIHEEAVNNLRLPADNPEEPVFSYEVPKPCPKVSFFAGAAAGTGISHFMRKDKNDPKMMLDYNIQQQPNPVGMTTQFYNAGLSGGISLPKGFFISTGINYMHYSVKNMSRVLMYPFNSGSFLNSSLIPTATGDVEFEPSVEDLSTTALSGGQIQGTIRQNFGFVNVPLKIGKLFGKKRLQISLAAGAAFNFKVLDNAKFITEFNEEREMKPAALKKFNCSIGIEPGIQYRISPNLSLNAGLELNYTLSNLSANNTYQLNNMLLGANLGLRWNSKTCR